MSTTADVIVLGLGAMGSAAACRLAERGKRVIGLDRFRPPHQMGSSSGGTRIIRRTYPEGPQYVPPLLRSFELWDELERRTGDRLKVIFGGISMGPVGSARLGRIRDNGDRFGLSYEVLDAAAIRRRYPFLRPTDEMEGMYDKDAGALFVDACVGAHLRLAAEAGAELHFDEPVTSWRVTGSGVEVKTASGTFTAEQLVIAAGAWLPQLVPDLRLPLRIERQVLLWFEPRRGASFGPDRCPNTSWEYEPGKAFYTQPDFGEGFKAAIHHQGEDTSPEKLRRQPDAEDERRVRELVERFIPDAAGRLLRAQVCMYTDTPDYHFLVDFHPEYRQVVIASPCSGHGFKFSAVMGEVLADLAIDGKSRFDLSLFSMKRLMAARA